MGSRAQQFRVKSLECFQAAQKVTDTTSRDYFLELAQHWRELADEVEALDRERPKPIN
jgi:hypothetical protein